MNHYYRSIWSSALNSWIAVAENTKRKTKSVSTNRQLLTAGLLLWSVPLLALPTGEQVVAGQVTISTPNAAQLQINQATPQAIVNWQNFSIQPHEIVAIQQPSINATLLNRVIGADASVIQGQLSANGQVFLINPNGVLFSPTAQVDVGGLIASTHAISNADFLQGHYHFTQSNADGLVNNQGVINVPNGGVVALIGSQVSNAGTITTPHGTTALAAGKTVDLDFQGDGLMAVSVSEAALNAQLENKGAILADGGRVVLTAQAAGDLIHSVVNHEGIIQARSLVERNGEIILAGGDNGATQVSGSLNVNGQTSGGTINVTGKNVTIAAKANITAQALDSGKAGNIAIFGDMKNGAVNVAGKLDASAPKTGDGGFIETSAAQVNIADSAKISTKAEQGKSGTWLIDPQDITVAVSGGNITGAALGTALSAGSVILDTSAAVGQASCSGAVTCTSFTGTTGDIFINDPVNWSANLLTLRADRNIYINRNLTGSGSAQLAFYYGRASASGGTNDDYFINGANVSLPAGANFTTQKGYSGTTYNYQVITNLGAAGDETTASTPATTLQGMARSTNLAGNYALGADILDASLTSGWNGGAGFSPIGDNTTAFSGQFDGLGHTITGLTISTTDTGFTGLFGYTSAASTISNIGLIGGNISANSSTSALPYTGGLVGENAGSIHHVYATSSVSSSATGSASAYAGGLVGDNTGSISNSYATGAISAVTTTTTSAADARAGGLVAQNSGSISNSYATGSVSTNASATTLFSDAYAGGLVGYNAGPTSNAYATGNVSATATSSSASASAYAGGLAGTNGVSGVITNGYATGSVTGAFAGGLVGGANAGTVTNAFWDTQSTGQADTGSVTGATGKITADMKQITPFSGAGWDISTASSDTTVWQINNGSSYPTLRSFITPTSLTVLNLTGNRVYDGTTNLPANLFTLNGLLAGDDLQLTGTGSLSTKNVGTYNSINFGTLLLTDGTVGRASNYTFTGGTQTVTITPASLNISAVSDTKVYDGTTTSTAIPTYSGLQTGDALTALTQNFVSKNVQGTNGSTLDVLSYTIDDGNSSKNYTARYNTASGTITPADLTLTARDISKVYDGTTQAVSSAMVSKGQLFSSDRLLESGNFAFTDKNAGTGKALALANVAINDGNGGANYNVSYVNSNNSSITPAPLLLTTNEVTKTYDGTTVANSSPVVSYGTLFGSDRVSGGSFAFTNKDTGTGKTVTVANVLIDDGNNGKNYSVDYLTNTTSTINKADLTLTAEDVSKMYDGTTIALGKALVSKGTLFTGDTLSGGLFAFVDKNAGTNKTVTVEGIQISDGNYGNNYAVSYADNTHSTIEQAPLTLSAKEVTKIYDGTVAAKGTAIVSSGTLFKGDTLTEAGFAFLDKNVGTNKTVTLSDLAVDDGNGGNNYKLTINDAIGAITPASLSITTSDVLKTYDATTQANGVATIKTGELFTGDTLSGGTFAFLDKNAGTGKTVTVKKVLLNDGNNGKNYQVSYVDNTSSTIDKANLTVTSFPVSKQYDGSTTAAGSLQLAAGKLYETDSLSGGSFTFLDKNAGSGKVVLTHDVSVKGSNNYALNYLDNTNSVITPAPLVLNAVSDSKVYDGTTDSSGVVSQTGLLNGDSLSSLSQAFASKNVLGANLSTLLVNNTYVLADGNGGKNYTVVSNTAKGSITPALLSVTTTDVLKTYDETTVALGSPTVASGTLFTGDSLAGGKFAFLDAAIGINKTVTVADVSVNDGNQGKNYLLTFANNSKSSIVPVVTPVVVAVVTPAIFPDTTLGAAMAIANQNATFVAAQNAVIAAQKAAETSNPKERPLVEKMVTNSVASLVNANNTTNTVAIAPVIIPTTGNTNSAVNNPSGGFNYQSNNPVAVDFTGGDTVSVASESSSDSTSATETASNNSATTEPDANESSDTSSAKLIGLSNALGSRTVIPTLTVKNSAGRVKALQLSENKNYVSLLLEDGSIRAWDFQRGVQRRITTQNKNNHLATIGTVNEKGELLSIASQAGIQTYDVVSSSTDASIASSTVNYFASSTDNQLLLTSHADRNQLSLWDNSQNKQLWQLPYQRGEIKSLAITKDKKVAAVLSHETGAYALPADLQLKNIQDAVDILDVASGKVITALPGFGEQVVYMQFQNEDTLQLALADGKVFNWSISTKKLENIANFAESILAVDIEKQTYAYILKEGSLQVGDGQGNIALKIENKENSFLNAKLLENGKRLLTVMENGDLAIWDVASGKKMLRLFSTKQGWTVMDALGRFDGSEEAMENFVWLADAEGMSLDSFSENYYEPGLLANVLQNQESFNDNAFAVTDGVSLPPKLALQLSDQQTDKDTVSLQLDVYDRGGGIKQLKVYQNERLLNNKEVIFSEQSATENGAEHKLLTLKVSPSAGKNSLKVVASNAMDIDSKGIELNFDGQSKAYTSSLKVLTIGINKYQEPQLHLNYSVADATLINDVLKSKAKISANKSLLDENATKAKILAELKELSQGTQQDSLVIYFAGHGVAKGKEWYFLPYETKLESSLDKIVAGAISATELSDIFKNSRIQHILLMVDSCHSGGSMDVFSKLENGQRFFSRQLSRSLGITVLTAAARNQEAKELKSLGHGLFTYLLNEELQKSDAAEPITAHSIAKNILKTLPAFSKAKTGSSQEPVSYMHGGDFILSKSLDK